MKTCCFTGHRNIPAERTAQLQQRLCDEISRLAENGYTTFISGGARGFDLLAAMAVMAVRKTHPEIKLRLILPCGNQAQRWNSSDKLLYDYILKSADSSETLHEAYITGCMQERNRKMVDSSNLCIAYLTRDFGGTKSTVDYALSKNVDILYVR